MLARQLHVLGQDHRLVYLCNSFFAQLGPPGKWPTKGMNIYRKRQFYRQWRQGNQGRAHGIVCPNCGHVGGHRHLASARAGLLKMRTWRVYQGRQTGEVAEHHSDEQAAVGAAWEHMRRRAEFVAPWCVWAW